MDIFSEFEGLSGESLCSALLRYLIFNSLEVREAFLSLLSDISPIGPISCSTHFACRTEYPTQDKSLGDGRLDMLMQLDDVVIGVEIKILAQFQKNQPQKYMKTLTKVSGSLKEINHAETKCLLFLVCPEGRKKEASEKTKNLKGNFGIVTWEDILSSFLDIKEVSNPVAGVVLKEFIGYLKRHLSFINDFNRKFPHLKNSFPEYGSPLQRELVGKLWSFFPSAGGRLGSGRTWLGYYFYAEPDIKQSGWFGFVPKKEIKSPTKNEAELIIATTYKPKLPSEFVEVELMSQNFIGAPNRTNAWIVNFDSNWNSVEVWRAKLSALWEALKDDI